MKIDTNLLIRGLRFFCDKDEITGQSWKSSEPFLRFGCVYATDKRNLIEIPAPLFGLDISLFEEGKLAAEQIIPRGLNRTGYIHLKDLRKVYEWCNGDREKEDICPVINLGNTTVSPRTIEYLYRAMLMFGAKAAEVCMNPVESRVSYIYLEPGIKIVFMPIRPGNATSSTTLHISSEWEDCAVHFDESVVAAMEKEEADALRAEEEAKRYVFLVPYVKRSYVPVYAKDEEEAKKIAEEHGDPDYDDDDSWHIDDTYCPEYTEAGLVADSYNDGICTRHGYISWEEFFNEMEED